jgi:hypothetical protein
MPERDEMFLLGDEHVTGAAGAGKDKLRFPHILFERLGVAKCLLCQNGQDFASMLDWHLVFV